MSFIHLHTYSAYSLLSSTITPQQLVKTAKQRGYEAIALTDKNALYGLIPFYKACLENQIKPIIGLTANILHNKNGNIEDQSGTWKKVQTYPLIFLAKNQNGLKNLLKISSAIQTQSPSGIPLKWLNHYKKDLFVISPGMEGEIEHLLLAGKEREATSLAKFFNEYFGNGNFYLSIQSIPTRESNVLLQQVLQLSETISFPYIPTNPIYFLNKEDYFSWKCLQAIKDNTTIDNINTRSSVEHYFLKDREAIELLFENYPIAMKNLEKLTQNCNVTIEFHQSLLPKYPLQNKTASEYLRELCEKGLSWRIENPPQKYLDRLNYELKIIQEMGFSDYFLIVWDFVRFARSKGITVGPGRGSATGSLVSYVLGITDVDPIKFDLLFERFLNPERVTMPDIDIDFPDHRRDEVIEYVAKKYGKNHVAQIITFGTFAAKQALRDVARVFGLSSKELEQFSRSIPSKLGITLTEARKESASLQKLLLNEQYQKIYSIAMKIEGLPRHTSTHAAGVVISDLPLVELVPLQNGTGNVLLTQYPMGTIEELGLLKMDFLGLRNLSLLESILANIQYYGGKRLALKDIPKYDEATFKLLQRGATTGIFQLESEGMRKVLMELKPTEFEDIVAVNALYRPGPMSNIPVYIRRKHQQEAVTYLHKDLEPILKRTYGVIVYQEQIMQIASKIAGFSLGEADLLRRAVSKKKREILDRERAHFVLGAKGKGYDEEVANALYDLIVRFADYGFNRSHAVAYSMISYQLAYLKSHYPLPFMAALLTSVIGNEEKIAEYVREIKQMGYTVLGPSINKSSYRFHVDNNNIRYSLAAIKGIGIQALKEITRARKEGEFTDIFDFCLRVSLKIINRKTLECLIYSGSFDEFGYDRATLLATLDVAINHADFMKPDEDQLNLLTDSIKPKYEKVEPMPIEIKLKMEKQVLGLFLSEHPVSIHRELLTSAGAKLLDELTTQMRGEKVGAYITQMKKIRTKNGEVMAFLTLNDEYAELASVIFPDMFRKYGSLIKEGTTVLLTGVKEVRNGNPQFIIQEVQSIEELKGRMKLKLYIKVPEQLHRKTTLMKLKNILTKHIGNTPVLIYYEQDHRTVQLLPDNWINIESTSITELKQLLGENNVVLKE
ncbi:DNA polymerase III subunit alpha [Bacillus kwashiorkori]|uniref:DNA polymerase III subunit alpha n=1 Tax=Bacillus kwashiorkori TaxID=1522318 RepID=UPI000782BB3C|nr:DNA polymerase III subunit alpha [Bacillus kwashiorkori]